MKSSFREPIINVLWVDFLLGSICGIAGIVFYSWFTRFLDLPEAIVLIISAVTFCYSLFALWLATRRRVSTGPLRLLIYANFLWALVSTILLFVYFGGATIYGKLYLVLQIVVVGGLALIEQILLARYKSSKDLNLIQ